jgi:gas vesicle protein
MRFLVGLLIGFGIGFALAVLFAPARTKRTEGFEPVGAAGETARPNGYSEPSGGMRQMLRSLQDHVNEAWAEARQASREAEREMHDRYEQKYRKPRDAQHR